MGEMFTGIIQQIGTIKAARAAGAGGKRLSIDVGQLADGIAIGDSVSVDGACLTVSELKGGVATFDVIAETLSRTTLGSRAAGRR